MEPDEHRIDAVVEREFTRVKGETPMYRIRLELTFPPFGSPVSTMKGTAEAARRALEKLVKEIDEAENGIYERREGLE